MIITYQDIEIDCTPAAIKAWVESQEAGAPVGMPGEGESCLVTYYLRNQLRPHELYPTIYVSGASMGPPEVAEQFVPHVDIEDETYTQDESLRRVVEACDKIKVYSYDGWDARKEQVLQDLNKAKVW